MSTSDDLEELFSQLEKRAVFSRRSEAIPGDLRMPWRVPMLCLILQRFRGKKSTLEPLHTIWWAIRSSDTRELFLRWLEGIKQPDEIIVRFDPSLSFTLDLARGLGLITVSASGSIVLTQDGNSYANSIWRQDGVVSIEKTFLNLLPNQVTQKRIKELTTW